MMSWWRNDDPYDDENEAEIRRIFICGFGFIIILVIALLFVGCTHTREAYNCKCDCKKQLFEFSESEKILEITQ